MARGCNPAAGDCQSLPTDYAGYIGWSGWQIGNGMYGAGGNGPNFTGNYIMVGARLAFAPSSLDMSVLDNVHGLQQITVTFSRLIAPDYYQYASQSTFNLTGLVLPITLPNPFGTISGEDNSATYRYLVNWDSDNYVYGALDNMVVP